MSNEGIIYLIGREYMSDKYGVKRPEKETRKKVRARIKSTGQKEYFEAGKNGLKVSDMTFVIPARKYGKETVVEYQGKQLSVYRTYKPADDLIELHCEQKGGVNGKDSD